MIQFGVRGHDFGKMPVAELADKIAEKGFTCLQLATAKAVPDIDCGAGKLSTGLARHIAKTFASKGINIAVLGCYVNISHPDDAERGKLLDRFKEHIRFTRDFDCPIVGTETGSVNGDYSFNPLNHGKEALETCIRSVAELVEEAEKFGAIVCIEAVAKHIVNTSKRMKQVLDTVKSNNLQVIYDPVNLMTPENYKDQDSIMKESFDLFGDRMMVLHAKDFDLADGAVKVVPVGTGKLNYRLLYDLVTSYKPFIYAMLEDTKPPFLDASRDYILKLANK
jgi:sugar phosphate isomerase/epimerase